VKKAFVAFAILLSLVGYSVWNRRVRIPMSNLYVHYLFAQPRLWGNGVEFDHRGWQELCWAPNGKVECVPLKQASPTAGAPQPTPAPVKQVPERTLPPCNVPHTGECSGIASVVLK
jgi:hypothetical protein